MCTSIYRRELNSLTLTTALPKGVFGSKEGRGRERIMDGVGGNEKGGIKRKNLSLLFVIFTFDCCH